MESPGTIEVVKRYHEPLRADFERIKQEYGRSITDKECLKMAVCCVNETVGPEGYCPMVLIYGIVPRPERNPHSIRS